MAGRRRWVVSVAFVSALPFLGACGLGQTDRAPDDPLVFDWRRGTYEGVRLGDTTDRLIRALGQPERRGRNEPGLPIGEEGHEIGALTNYGSPDIGRRVADFEDFRYRRRVFGIVGERVVDFGTTDERAQTPEGVGLGDSRDLVKRR